MYEAPYKCPMCERTYYVREDSETAGCECGFKMPPSLLAEARDGVRRKNEKLAKAVGPQEKAS